MDLLQNLQGMLANIEANDPLLQRGIQRDWVCVIHPSMEFHLRHSAPLNPDAFDRLERITGRETWILNSAPMNKIEYMPKLDMYKRYAEEFAAQARLAAIRKADEDKPD